jgi:ATP synthase protein I
MRRIGRVFLTLPPRRHYGAPRFHGFEGFAMADRRTPDEEAGMTERLRQLGARIGEAGVRREQQAQDLREQEMESQKRASNLARGFQLSGEFVAGILLGSGAGWAVDYFAGISPWGLIVGLLLGFAAGTLNVMRSAGVAAPQGSSWTKKD